jgi:hypothetical protein
MLGAILAALPAAARAQGSFLDQGKSLLNDIPKSGGGNAPPSSNGARTGSGAALSQSEIGSGLKDALKVAS